MRASGREGLSYVCSLKKWPIDIVTSVYIKEGLRLIYDELRSLFEGFQNVVQRGIINSTNFSVHMEVSVYSMYMLSDAC